jgi:hypothetical protein
VEGEDGTGEEIMARELNTLYVQHGVEYATDDVSGAVLDPSGVREARGVEMDFFRTTGYMTMSPDPNRSSREERSSGPSG